MSLGLDVLANVLSEKLGVEQVILLTDMVKVEAKSIWQPLEVQERGQVPNVDEFLL